MIPGQSGSFREQCAHRKDNVTWESLRALLLALSDARLPVQLHTSLCQCHATYNT